MLAPKLIQKLRLLCALSIAILCIAGFLGIFYPIKLFDIEVVPLVQQAIVNLAFFTGLLLLAILAATLVFGRIYCSTVCPLGLAQELCLLLFHRKKLPPQKNRAYKYFIAAASFGTLCGGTAFVIRQIDPYTIFGSAASGTVYGLVLLAFIACLTGLKGRYFCTNICPVGTVLGLLSRHAYHKIYIDAESCVACGLCAQKCPAGCIDFKNKTVDNETCIKCFRCLTLCHNQGLGYGHKTIKKPLTPFNSGRRRFILGAAVLALAAAAYKSGIKLSQDIAAKVTKIILPAGAVSPERFANKCLNCNLCVENCPMKILKKADGSFPAVHIDYSNKNFCDYDCRKCSEICPSGAIKRITLAQKQKTQIGLAVINEDICIQCGLCVRECPRKVIEKNVGEFPQISPDKCIGCGACHAVCPVSAIKIVPLEQQKELLNI